MSVLRCTEQYKKIGNVELGPEQIEAVDFLLCHRGAILALQTGLGKSIVASVAAKIVLDSFQNARVVCVVPVKALKSWRREMFDRLGFTYSDVGILSTEKVSYDIKSNKVFLITNTNAEKYAGLFQELVDNGNKILLMIDEAHNLQDKNTKFYQTMVSVRNLCTITWLITATPLLNGLESLYYIVSYAVPGFLGTKTGFIDRYFIWHLRDQYLRGGRKVKVREIDGYQNLDELNAKLKQIMIVRQKEYNLKFHEVLREMTPKEYEVYTKVSSGLFESEEDERNFPRRMNDLQRFIDRAYRGDDTIEELAADYGVSRYSTKEETLLKVLKSCLSKGYSTIIYCEYRETIERLSQVLEMNKADLNLGSVFEITGSISIKKRERIEEMIGQRDVVLITSAGTESINLQRCNCVILYDISFSSKQIIQTVGRVCRRDSLYAAQYVVAIVMSRTIDEYKYRLFQTHLEMIQKAVGAGSDIPLNEEYLLQDSRDIRKLKDELLWAYKGSRNKRRRFHIDY